MLSETFPVRGRLLEIGCATAQEAVLFAARGYEVVGIDISAAMVEIARRRAGALGFTDRLTFRRMVGREVGLLTAEFGPRSFDGAYSSLSTLNHEPDLTALGAGLSVLLKPGAKFFVSVLNRTCLWETVWLLTHFHPRGAFRRWKRWAKASIGPGANAPAQFYTARSFVEALGEAWKLQRVLALPLFLPPPALGEVYQRHEQFFAKLLSLERHWRERAPWSRLGHFFVAVLVHAGPSQLD